MEGGGFKSIAEDRGAIRHEWVLLFCSSQHGQSKGKEKHSFLDYILFSIFRYVRTFYTNARVEEHRTDCRF